MAVLAALDGGCSGPAPIGPGQAADSGSPGDGGVVCTAADCAGLAAPAIAKLCPDGTSIGETLCSAGASGACQWGFPPCPSPPDDGGVSCPGLGCAPSCPNGVLKDSNGCDTCLCAPSAEGGSPGAACTTSADCADGGVCGFVASGGCSAGGTCFASPGVVCNLYSPGCGCDGESINVACNGLPSGYVPAPLLHTGVCTAPLEDGGDGGDGGACCPSNWSLYACTYPDGGAGQACHNPALGCASSTTCGQGCDEVVIGRCG